MEGTQNLIALAATTKPVAKDNRKARQAGQNRSQVATSRSGRPAAQLNGCWQIFPFLFFCEYFAFNFQSANYARVP